MPKAWRARRREANRHTVPLPCRKRRTSYRNRRSRRILRQGGDRAGSLLAAEDFQIPSRLHFDTGIGRRCRRPRIESQDRVFLELQAAEARAGGGADRNDAVGAGGGGCVVVYVYGDGAALR